MKLRVTTSVALLLSHCALLGACSSTPGAGEPSDGTAAVGMSMGGAAQDAFTAMVPTAGTAANVVTPMVATGGTVATGGAATGVVTAGGTPAVLVMGGAPAVAMAGAATMAGGAAPAAGGAATGGAGVGGPPMFEGDPVNVSTGQPCQSSANFTPNLPCELALDGVISQESRWESQQGVDDGWMYVDLGTTYAVSEIDIYWEHSGALVHEAQVWTKYDMEPTDVDADWVAVAREDNLANHEHHDLIESLYPIDPVVTRYVRVRCFKRMWEWGNSIFELDVFGVPAMP